MNFRIHSEIRDDYLRILIYVMNHRVPSLAFNIFPFIERWRRTNFIHASPQGKLACTLRYNVHFSEWNMFFCTARESLMVPLTKFTTSLGRSSFLSYAYTRAKSEYVQVLFHSRTQPTINIFAEPIYIFLSVLSGEHRTWVLLSFSSHPSGHVCGCCWCSNSQDSTSISIHSPTACSESVIYRFFLTTTKSIISPVAFLE